MNTAALGWGVADARSRARALGVGLWVFIGVASTLFALFLAAYVMRMASGDGVTLAMPRQLWLSTALLVAGSMSMQASGAAARRAQWARARSLWLAGGAGALAFLVAQGWSWQALQAAGVTIAGNPAGSFFYLLTAMHGLHVLGGLAAWAATAQAVAQPAVSATPAASADAAQRIALCARYWHFLLALWVVLFAAMAGLTPELARLICGVPG